MLTRNEYNIEIKGHKIVPGNVIEDYVVIYAIVSEPIKSLVVPTILIRWKVDENHDYDVIYMAAADDEEYVIGRFVCDKKNSNELIRIAFREVLIKARQRNFMRVIRTIRLISKLVGIKLDETLSREGESP